jgi:hypothetical protein
MHVESKNSKSELSVDSISELTQLFAQVPPMVVREAVIKVYLCYATSDDADLPQDVEKIDKPIQALIGALGKIAGVK